MTKQALAKKAAAKGKSEVGQGYACGVCGLAVTADEDCGCAVTHDLICCDTSMKKDVPEDRSCPLLGGQDPSPSRERFLLRYAFLDILQ